MIHHADGREVGRHGPGGPREATPPPPPPADAPLGVLGQQPYGDGLHLGVLLQAALPPAENEGRG